MGRKSELLLYCSSRYGLRSDPGSIPSHEDFELRRQGSALNAFSHVSGNESGRAQLLDILVGKRNSKRSVQSFEGLVRLNMNPVCCQKSVIDEFNLLLESTVKMGLPTWIFLLR